MSYFEFVYTEVLTYLGFFVVNPIDCAYIASLQAVIIMSVGFIVWGIYRQISIMKVWKQSSTSAGNRWLKSMDRIAKRIGLRKLPEIRFTNKKLPICTVGFFEPAIYVPKQADQKIIEDDLEIIVEHELWHIKKRHNLKKLMMRSVGMVGSLWLGFAFGLAMTYRVLDQRYEIIDLALSFIFGFLFRWFFYRYIIPYFDLWCEYQCDEALSMRDDQRWAMASMLVRSRAWNTFSEATHGVLRSAATSHLEKRVRRLLRESSVHSSQRYIRGLMYIVVVLMILSAIHIHKKQNLRWVSGHGKRMHLCVGQCE